MSPLRHESTMLTLTTRFLVARRVAEQELAEPEGEALLSHASRTMEQDRCREGSACTRIRQATAKFLVAEHRHDWHRLETYTAAFSASSYTWRSASLNTQAMI